MKRFDSGDAVAKEIGISPATLKKTFDDYNTAAKTKKDPFGKKVRIYIWFVKRRLTPVYSSFLLASGG
jgi:hypothetical protein